MGKWLERNEDVAMLIFHLPELTTTRMLNANMVKGTSGWKCPVMECHETFRLAMPLWRLMASRKATTLFGCLERHAPPKLWHYHLTKMQIRHHTAEVVSPPPLWTASFQSDGVSLGKMTLEAADLEADIPYLLAAEPCFRQPQTSSLGQMGNIEPGNENWLKMCC